MQRDEVGVRASLTIDEVRIYPVDILPKLQRLLPICVKAGPTERTQTDYEVLTAIRKAVGSEVALGDGREHELQRERGIGGDDRPRATSIGLFVATGDESMAGRPMMNSAPYALRGHCVVPQLPAPGVSVDEKAVHARALARTGVNASGFRELH